MPDELKSTDLARARRAACASPHICFEFGDDVSCPPCETMGVGLLRERERCVAILQKWFFGDPCYSKARDEIEHA